MQRWPALAILLLFSLTACGPDKGANETPAPGAGGPNPIVVIETSMGTIKAELYADKAPITVKNFMEYVDDKFFDDTIFHRVIPNFMIQGGGFAKGTRREKGKTRAPIKNEAGNGLLNKRGTLAMARTNDPNSATAQFFINTVDNRGLDRPNPDGYGYAVFGKVIDGMDNVDQIQVVRTGVHEGMKDFPISDVVIKSIRRESK